MERFAGRRGDLTWGKYDYPVTRSQKNALEALEFMMRRLPRAHPSNGDMPAGYFCSQRPDSGDVVIGLYRHSVNVHRTGRITRNQDLPTVKDFLEAATGAAKSCNQ